MAQPSHIPQEPAPAKRTAVLVVHGIGNQRALETVRGVAAAVLDKRAKLWVHPETSGIDVDLSVLTANQVCADRDARDVDFHELYWAHLMSETRAVAVLLWLFELVRKGPLLKSGTRAVWWGSATFLATLLASVTLLFLHLIQRCSQVVDEVSALLLAPMFVVCAAAAYTGLASAINKAWKICISSTMVALALAAFLHFGLNYSGFNHLTDMFFPPFVSALVIFVAMGGRGVLVWAAVYLLLNIALMFVQNARYQIWWDRSNIISDMIEHRWVPFLTPGWQPFWKIWHEGWIAWSMTEHWSTTIACWTIVLYFALNAVFLQSYLGDAARYFRNSPGNVAVRREIRKQAVSTLASLHESGLYDRIVVVAHSLGSVIAYDMLRTYFSRVCNNLPPPEKLGQVVAALNNFQLTDEIARDPVELALARDKFRALSRQAIGGIVDYFENTAGQVHLTKWLVTDFVTLGSPLTHAEYLMCTGSSREELVNDFARRVDEREFPTCPPNGNNRLIFKRPGGQLEFHHGAVFGLTRWTNVYFPLSQLFWGDAIGGPISDLFGHFIEDRPIVEAPAFFTHTRYWKTSVLPRKTSLHISELDRAINLSDVRES